jgi:hypothetical protein
MHVVLDAGPLGLVTNPAFSPASAACSKCLEGILLAGHEVIVPEIADYEVRRELIAQERRPDYSSSTNLLWLFDTFRFQRQLCVKRRSFGRLLASRGDPPRETR